MSRHNETPVSQGMADYRAVDSSSIHNVPEYEPFVREIHLDYGKWQNIPEAKLPWYEYNRSSEHRKEMNSIYRILIPRLWEIIVTGLSSRQREVIILHFRFQLNQVEIAKKLGVSQPTVSQHINGKKRNGKKVGGAIRKIKKVIRKMASGSNPIDKDLHLVMLLNQLLDNKTSYRKAYKLLHSIIK